MCTTFMRNSKNRLSDTKNLFDFPKFLSLLMAKNHDFESIITSQCQFINPFNTANFWVAPRFMAKIGSFWAFKCHNFGFAFATDLYELSFFSIFYCASSEIKGNIRTYFLLFAHSAFWNKGNNDFLSSTHVNHPFSFAFLCYINIKSLLLT